MWQIGFGTSQTKYLADCCVAVSDIAGRQRLRSTHRRQLNVPRHQRSTLGRLVFSVAGQIVWNSITDELRDGHENSIASGDYRTENTALQPVLVCAAH